jgi:putative flippase GtrA
VSSTRARQTPQRIIHGPCANYSVAIARPVAALREPAAAPAALSRRGQHGPAHRPLRFTILIGDGTHPLSARVVSLVIATLVTWRLNRAITFDPTGRHQGEEALRYALVTVTAQGTNYAVFASLVVTAFASFPQGAVLAGAVAGAGLSYGGHRMFSFARRAFPQQIGKPEEVALQ